MSNRILVAIDQSPQGRAALQHAISIFPDAEIHALHVLDPREWVYVDEHGGGIYSERIIEGATETAEDLLSKASERADEAGVSLTTAIERGDPAKTIVEYAENNDADYVFIGSHGRRGLSRFLLGSVAEQVARRAPVPVTIVRTDTEEENDTAT
jgi:nucleotide-binding universal stress UspA family protein